MWSQEPSFPITLSPSKETTWEKFWSSQDAVSTLHPVSLTEHTAKKPGRNDWGRFVRIRKSTWQQVWGRKPEFRRPLNHACDSGILFASSISRPGLKGSPNGRTLKTRCRNKSLQEKLSISALKSGKGHPDCQGEQEKLHFCFCLFSHASPQASLQRGCW